MSDDQHEDFVAALADKLGKHQVFGVPVQQGKTTLVPVAQVRVGGGVHRRNDDAGTGVVSRPIGAWSLSEDGAVAWHPAVDVNRIARGGQFALAAVLVATVVAYRRRR